jgi:hypothetical protein
VHSGVLCKRENTKPYHKATGRINILTRKDLASHPQTLAPVGAPC